MAAKIQRGALTSGYVAVENYFVVALYKSESNHIRLFICDNHCATAGLDTITEYQLEQAVADFEVQCAEGLTEKMDSVKGVEFDDTVVCDICRSVCGFFYKYGFWPFIRAAIALVVKYKIFVFYDFQPDAEDTNEMVFCDGCNICVHQACYGIMKVPQGSWLCRICALAIKPDCVLCPRTGGAMKCTK